MEAMPVLLTGMRARTSGLIALGARPYLGLSSRALHVCRRISVVPGGAANLYRSCGSLTATAAVNAKLTSISIF